MSEKHSHGHRDSFYIFRKASAWHCDSLCREASDVHLDSNFPMQRWFSWSPLLIFPLRERPSDGLFHSFFLLKDAFWWSPLLIFPFHGSLLIVIVTHFFPSQRGLLMVSVTRFSLPEFPSNGLRDSFVTFQRGLLIVIVTHFSLSEMPSDGLRDSFFTF